MQGTRVKAKSSLRPLFVHGSSLEPPICNSTVGLMDLRVIKCSKVFKRLECLRTWSVSWCDCCHIHEFVEENAGWYISLTQQQPLQSVSQASEALRFLVWSPWSHSAGCGAVVEAYTRERSPVRWPSATRSRPRTLADCWDPVFEAFELVQA